VDPHCSFCGSAVGPFRAVEGLFTVLMCQPCQDARGAATRAAEAEAPAELAHDGADPPPEGLSDDDQGEP
jgi:hypothetical protein